MRCFHEGWNDISKRDNPAETNTRVADRPNYELRLGDFIPVRGLRDYCVRTRDVGSYDLDGRITFTRNLLLLAWLNSPFIPFMKSKAL